MKIIKPSVELLSITPNAEKLIERAGRVCYKSENLITEESFTKFIQNIIKRGHEAVLEHASASLLFICDRGVTHEIIRHRLAAYCQESTRYCVTGDSKLTCKNKHQYFTIEELYNDKINSKNGSWKRLNIKQLNENSGELIYNRILDIFYNGEKEVFQIKTRLGYNLKLTANHKIHSINGYKELKDLKIGDKISVNGQNISPLKYTSYDWLFYQNITLNKTFISISKEFDYNISTLKKWARILKIPKKGTGYFNIGKIPWNKGLKENNDIRIKNQGNALRKYHYDKSKKGIKILKYDTSEYQKNIKNNCEICNTSKNLEVHHIDENRKNHNPNNLLTVCESCHLRLHSKNLNILYFDKIVEIKSVGLEKVYDITMKSNYKNFIANGVIVHNCNYSKDKFDNQLIFIEPCFWKSSKYEVNSDELKQVVWKNAMLFAENTYKQLIEYGATPQEARSVLPNSLKTEIVVTANMREWRHILKLRTSEFAHPQIKEVMLLAKKILNKECPNVFGDIK
jgi:thymidylate synthase ThyX